MLTSLLGLDHAVLAVAGSRPNVVVLLADDSGWSPPLSTNQHTIPRASAESRMKEFRPLNPGVIHLDKGRGLLRLLALEIPGRSVMDLRLVTLAFHKQG